MFLCVFILILILPITFLSLALEDFFSSDELDAMGIAYYKHGTASTRESKSLRKSKAVV